MNEIPIEPGIVRTVELAAAQSRVPPVSALTSTRLGICGDSRGVVHRLQSTVSVTCEVGAVPLEWKAAVAKACGGRGSVNGRIVDHTAVELADFVYWTPAEAWLAVALARRLLAEEVGDCRAIQ